MDKRRGEVRKNQAPHQLVAAIGCFQKRRFKFKSTSGWVWAFPLASPSHSLLGWGCNCWMPRPTEIPAEPWWIKGWEYFWKSLSPALATPPALCLFQYLNPAHPSSMIKGALLDLLRMCRLWWLNLAAAPRLVPFSPVPCPCWGRSYCLVLWSQGFLAYGQVNLVRRWCREKVGRREERRKLVEVLIVATLPALILAGTKWGSAGSQPTIPPSPASKLGVTNAEIFRLQTYIENEFVLVYILKSFSFVLLSQGKNQVSLSG